MDADRRVEQERARVEAEYRRILKSSVAFEKRIRNRWREKCREKNGRIAELEARVRDLETRLAAATAGEGKMDREIKERKLVALMINDFGTADADEAAMAGQARDLSEDQLDRTLTERLGLAYPVDEQELELALNGVEEPEQLSGGSTGAPDMSHNPGPGENTD